MIRRGIDFVALFYLSTALICFLPYFQFDHPILVAAGLIYAIPCVIIAGGLALRRAWGRKLAILFSSFLILVVFPLLFKKQLTFVFSFPFSIAVTYPPGSVLSFKGLFGTLIVGHLLSMFYLLRGSVRRAFQRERAEEEKPKEEGSGDIDLDTGKEENAG